MKVNLIPMTAVALVAALLVSVQQAQAVDFRGGTMLGASNRENCCHGVRDNGLFDFNGGTGSILGIADRNQTDLDIRVNDTNNGIWNAGNNDEGGNPNVGDNQAVFSIAPLAGNELITGFQVMNGTNAQFDDKQTEILTVEVSTDGGSTFVEVFNGAIDTINLDGGNGGSASTNQMPAPAQEFLLSNAIGGVDQIRLTAFNGGANTGTGSGFNGGGSLSEFRILVDTTVPEPATAGLLVLSVGGFVMRRRRRLA